MINTVYIATSLDGFIATEDGGIDWLMQIPNPENNDYGFADFMNTIDAVVMGRNTYQKVLALNCGWPYSKKVFILTITLEKVDPSLTEKAEIIQGSPKNIVKKLNDAGYNNLYIDGAITIQNFLKENLIDEMIITTVPVTLKNGIPLFTNKNHEVNFTLASTKTYTNGFITRHYKNRKNL